MPNSTSAANVRRPTNTWCKPKQPSPAPLSTCVVACNMNSNNRTQCMHKFEDVSLLRTSPQDVIITLSASSSHPCHLIKKGNIIQPGKIDDHHQLSRSFFPQESHQGVSSTATDGLPTAYRRLTDGLPSAVKACVKRMSFDSVDEGCASSQNSLE